MGNDVKIQFYIWQSKENICSKWAIESGELVPNSDLDDGLEQRKLVKKSMYSILT